MSVSRRAAKAPVKFALQTIEFDRVRQRVSRQVGVAEKLFCEFTFFVGNVEDIGYRGEGNSSSSSVSLHSVTRLKVRSHLFSESSRKLPVVRRKCKRSRLWSCAGAQRGCSYLDPTPSLDHHRLERLTRLIFWTSLLASVRCPLLTAFSKAAVARAAYVGFNSIPRDRRPSAAATTQVVPDPTNGSRTKSPGALHAPTIL